MNMHATCPPSAANRRRWRAIDLRREFAESGVAAVLEELDRELIGLAPVKQRIRETAALLLVERARKKLGLAHETPTLHMSFTGNPGTGKTTVALRMADLLHRLGYVRKGQLVTVTRDDLVGQYIGHTAPKTKEILKKAMGGVLFIDEAYYLYRPENERDYGQEAIEILLQVMENQRDDLVVILAGYADRMDALLRLQPGLPLAHRPPHRLSRLLRTRSCSASPSRCWRSRTIACRRRRREALAQLHRRGAAAAAFRQRAARSATRSTARACARRTGCSSAVDRSIPAELSDHRGGRSSWRAACSRCRSWDAESRP